MPISIQVAPTRLDLIKKTLNSKFANKGITFVKDGKPLSGYILEPNNQITPQIKEDILSKVQNIIADNPESGIYLSFFA